jgi:hypothetical protein
MRAPFAVLTSAHNETRNESGDVRHRPQTPRLGGERRGQDNESRERQKLRARVCVCVCGRGTIASPARNNTHAKLTQSLYDAARGSTGTGAVRPNSERIFVCTSPSLSACSALTALATRGCASSAG